MRWSCPTNSDDSYPLTSQNVSLPADTTATPCYTSLTEAINIAVAGDSIEIRPGTYTGNFTINKSVSISGNETATTFLSGGGSGPVLTIDNAATSISVRRLTFINASTGILSNSPSVTITNNIFQVGTGNTAISLTASTTTEISNNTFYQNKDGILSTSGTVNTKNNIFSSQTTAISSNIAVLGILNNLFFTSTIGPPLITDKNSSDWKGNIADSDPLFVDSTQPDINKRDFHLKNGTPCKDAGNSSVGADSVDTTTADIGAYGGPNADTISYLVSGVTATGTTAAPYTITVNWPANNAYTVKGYKSTTEPRQAATAAQGRQKAILPCW